MSRPADRGKKPLPSRVSVIKGRGANTTSKQNGRAASKSIAKAPPPAAPQQEIPTPVLVVRKEIRELPSEEQERFCNALEKLFEDKPGQPQSSEYFQLAGYHGWPGEHGIHGQETFPGWHRAYLKAFESALQDADRALGNDGAIAVPYWDWLDTSKPDVVPAIIRQRFGSMPSQLVREQNQLQQVGYAQVCDDATVARNLRRAQVSFQVQGALAASQHWQFASTRYAVGYSIEHPHHSVLTALGFPLSSPAYAAFHPIFFLHLCNLDRIYQTFLDSQKSSQAEFEAMQRNLSRTRGEDDRYIQPLTPFTHPAEDRPFMPADTFSTAALYYQYDKLVQLPHQRAKEAPVYAEFANIEVNKLEGKSYVLHMFIMPIEQTKHWAVPPPVLDTWDGVPGYAGTGSVMGCPSKASVHSHTRPPMTLVVDITEAAHATGLSRHALGLRVLTVDEAGAVRPLEDTHIPQPIVTGPFFEDNSLLLQKVDGEVEERITGEVRKLQEYLQKYGYYGGIVDGLFGSKTDVCVRMLQASIGVPMDGIAGPSTKAAMMRPRYDDRPDLLMAEALAAGAHQEGGAFKSGQLVKFWIGDPPGYVDTEAAEDEVRQALGEWAQVVPLHFHEVESPQEAHIRVLWADRTPHNVFKYDGRGGALSTFRDGSVVLDLCEHWLLQGQPPRPGSFYLLPVLLHELGHALGLGHSQDPQDVMAPFYDEAKIRLKAGDEAMVGVVYPLDLEMARLFATLDLDQDGRLTKQELIVVLTQHGPSPLTPEEVSIMYDEAIAGGPDPGGMRVEAFTRLMHKYFFE